MEPESVEQNLDDILKIMVGDIKLKDMEDPAPYLISQQRINNKRINFIDLQSHFNGLHEIYISELLDILEENKYVINSREGNFLYSSELTYRGKMFIQNGGYKEIRRKEQFEQQRINKLDIDAVNVQKQIKRLTFWIAVSAVVSALYYTQQLCHANHWFRQ